MESTQLMVNGEEQVINPGVIETVGGQMAWEEMVDKRKVKIDQLKQDKVNKAEMLESIYAQVTELTELDKQIDALSKKRAEVLKVINNNPQAHNLQAELKEIAASLKAMGNTVSDELMSYYIEKKTDRITINGEEHQIMIKAKLRKV